MSGYVGTGASVGRREPVEKLYVRDQRTQPSHLIGAAAGLGLAAWGLGRSGIAGRALTRGVRAARAGNNGYAIEALQRAQAAQGVLRHATAPGERALRNIAAVDQAVNRVPAALRPEIAAAAGALLVGRSLPLRENTYHPVNINIRSHR